MPDQPEHCPPHRFHIGWVDENHAALYCRWCGEVRELTPQSIGSPGIERIESDAKP